MFVLGILLVALKVLVLAAVVFLVVSLVVDAVWRRYLGSHVSVEYKAGDISQTLLVYLPGILSGGSASSVDLIDTWRRYGDVMLVEYGNQRFRAPVVVRTVCRAIRRYDAEKSYTHVVFIGSSMGGLLAYDIIKRHPVSDDVSADLLLLDAPTSASDLYAIPSWAATLAPWLIRVLTFGPIWNSFNLVAKMFVPPKEVNVEPGVDRVELARRVEEAKKYRLSFWRDQLLYIMSHGVLPAMSLERRIGRLDYIRSSRDDDTVRPEAFDAWAKTVAFLTRHVVDSTHVGFAERPETWKQAFEDVLGDMM